MLSRKASKSVGVVPRQIFSSREQKVIVRYLHSQETDPSEIHKLLSAACGKESPSYKEVKTWIQDIEEGREELDNCVCFGGRKISGLQTEVATDPALVARVETLMSNDIRISLTKLAEFSCSSPQTIQIILYTLLGLKRVAECWVPRTWTPEQRKYRMKVCQDLLNLYHEDGDNFLKRIVVGDASFVLYHTSANGSGSTAAPPAPREQNCPGGKYRPHNDPEKVYSAFFFDMSGVLVSEALPNTNPLSAEEYVEVLRDLLIPAYKRKRGVPTRPIYLLHSITPEHTAIPVQEAMRELNIIQLPNAVASPDLEPFEFWFFRLLKGSLEHLHFTSRTDLWSALQRQVHGITDLEFTNSIARLVDRWNICIEKQGLYLL